MSDVKAIIRAAEFGGASVTIPLKLDIIPLLDGVTPAGEVIGAVNTIIPETINGKTRLIGDNTDWLGMTHSLINSANDSSSTIPVGSSGLVIGAGGTARAAIYALHSLSFSPIYIISRTPGRLATMVASFPDTYNLRIIHSVAEAEALQSPPSVAIVTIPAD